MQKLSFTYDIAGIIDDQRLQVLHDRVQSTMQAIEKRAKEGLHSHYASLFLLSADTMIDEIKHLAIQKKELQPDMMVLVGIGGSNLGTWAVHDALSNPGIPIYYADTIDPEKVAAMLHHIEASLQNQKKVLVVIISKSGSTTETIINATLFVDLLKHYRPRDYRSFIVAITEEQSKLWNLAQQESWALLAVPHEVSGRFSVFSAVGLFPLSILGVDIDALIAGAISMQERCLTEYGNEAMTSASLLFAAYQAGYVIHDFFTFSSALCNVGMWYRQLLAESIGKEFDEQGKRIVVGITPTVSIGSTDLHSMVELHLGGPHNTFTTFLNVVKRKEILIPAQELTMNLLPAVEHKTLAQVMDAIFEGTQRAYRKKELPFATILLPELDPFYIGQLLQWKMMEIIFLGALFEVNPFVQPQVELYKREAKALLEHE